MIEVEGYQELNKILWEERDSDKVMMLYFSTSWCGPCKKLKEKFKEESDKLEKLCILQIDCDLEQNEDIVDDWKIECLPTQIFVQLKDKNVIKNDRIEGYDWIKFLMAYNKIIENKINYSLNENSNVKANFEKE